MRDPMVYVCWPDKTKFTVKNKVDDSGMAYGFSLVFDGLPCCCETLQAAQEWLSAWHEQHGLFGCVMSFPVAEAHERGWA